MTLTLWRITKEVAVFEDDQMIGWDDAGHWYCCTKGEDDAANLIETVANENDCEVRVDMVKVFEVPTYEILEIVKALSRTLPPAEA